MADAGAHSAPVSACAPENVVGMWLAQEVLKPQSHKRGKVPTDLENYPRTDLLHEPLPWDVKENHRKFFIVMLGEIDMTVALLDLYERFPDGLDEPRPSNQASPLAYLLFDNTGRIVREPDCVSLASFAWGLRHALEDQLYQLRDWPHAEVMLKSEFLERLVPVDAQNHWLQATPEFLIESLHFIAAEFGLTRKQLRIRVDAFEVYLPAGKVGTEANPVYPEMPLLNSFHLADLLALQARVEQENVPETLAQYLAMRPQGGSPDLLSDKAAVEELLAPHRFPHARWPVAGGHGLVSLQQAAVNAVQSHLGGTKGVLAVNGPPGTGKTTLLRDLIAYCVCERAAALIGFENPKTAFTKTNRSVPAGSAFYSISLMNPSLRGFELLVASSNNRAVENVSLELPQTKSVEDGIHYFPSIAKSLYGHASGATENDEGDVWCAKDADDEFPPMGDSAGPADSGELLSWGIVAAALGNSMNRNVFANRFWFDKHRSMQTYLKAVRGQDVRIRVDSGPEERYIQPALLSEEPDLWLDPAQQKREWSRLRTEFKRLKEHVHCRMEELEAARALPAKYEELRSLSVAAKQMLAEHEQAMVYSTQEHERASSDFSGLEAKSDDARRDVDAWGAARPGFFARMFGTAAFRDWNYQQAKKQGYASELTQKLRTAKQALTTTEGAYKTHAQRHKELRQQVLVADRDLEACTTEMRELRKQLGGAFVDADFFAAGHEVWNTACAWVDQSLQQERADLFVLALAVHKSFVTLAAAEVQHNLGALFSDWKSSHLQGRDDQELLAHLWSTLFLTVPVISTTFASVPRMLGKLPAEALGWLLVDEAGQAAPQEAVGAMMRAKRAVVVGDPLQIKPVMGLPAPFISHLAAQYGVSPSRWSGEDASVQTLADHASPVNAVFSSGGEPRLAGMPLLVHRRCQEPMFSISNAIAYDGQMVHAAGADPMVPVAQVLGASAWLDVVPRTYTGNKWCAAEGQVVLGLLRQLADAGVQNPNIYLISPFRDVVYGLHSLLRRQTQLMAALGIDDHAWLSGHIGTVHTFQGKEADVVIAVLGAPEDGHERARGWAAGTPNVANVMATRAKYRLYVVGSRQAWGRVGCFATVAKYLPVR